MAWFRVDDQFGSNPKVMMIPRAERKACLGLWLLAGVWSAQHLTDGVVPEYMLEELGTDVSQRDRLVTVGLWSETGDGIAFNDWEDYQPSRAEVMAKREAERARKEQWRAKRAESRGKVPEMSPRDTGGTDGDVRAESALPDPARPDPAPIKEEVAKATSKKGSRLAPNWMPSRDDVAAIAAQCPGLDTQIEHLAFVDYWIAVPGQKGVKLDWSATWRNWMRRKFQDRGGGQVARAPISSKPSPGQKARSVADELREEGL